MVVQTDPAGSGDQIQSVMTTYRFSIATVRVIELANFNVAEVYDVTKKMVHEIRTTAKGKRAAQLAFHDALRCRLI